EREAQQRNLPRGWVVPDVVLIEIARRAPDSSTALATIPDLKPGMLRRDGEALLAVVAEAARRPAQTIWDATDRLDAAQMTLVKRLAACTQERARAANLSATLIAPKRELIRLVRGDPGSAVL